jgi:hypothetical protein
MKGQSGQLASLIEKRSCHQLAAHYLNGFSGHMESGQCAEEHRHRQLQSQLLGHDQVRVIEARKGNLVIQARSSSANHDNKKEGYTAQISGPHLNDLFLSFRACWLDDIESLQEQVRKHCQHL